jgi:hypothetical protein
VKLSIATIAGVATDQVISVAMPLAQPSKPVNYLGTDLSERKKVSALIAKRYDDHARCITLAIRAAVLYMYSF